MSVRSRPFGLFLTLCFASLACGSACAADVAQPSAGSVTKAFYEWYLKQLSSNHDPIEDGRDPLANYVSKRLIKQIDHRRRSPDGLDADYFIEAQDYLDAWLGPVVVVAEQQTGETAREAVILGQGSKEARRLQVDLLHEQQGWRIVTVLRPSAIRQH